MYKTYTHSLKRFMGAAARRGAPKRLTDFKAEQIIAFDWSRDGRTLAFVRGVETSDVVPIEQGQK